MSLHSSTVSFYWYNMLHLALNFFRTGTGLAWVGAIVWKYARNARNARTVAFSIIAQIVLSLLTFLVLQLVSARTLLSCVIAEQAWGHTGLHCRTAVNVLHNSSEKSLEFLKNSVHAGSWCFLHGGLCGSRVAPVFTECLGITRRCAQAPSPP